ncbi:MAG TPA: 1-deoxy-D-xylulose-5-phosphate synthase [Firmicutes bacterium]|jgi:1-deoxy-D-xylulose-5-phosphate synthase|nr:1-deoxy-D-xylulose-5-phosphate synthase [Bacillota bacterium]
MLTELKLPEDLKKLSFTELEVLANEIRTLLVNTVARQGGHLAPNLGVVELTLALHKVFDSPNDKIIWDVGHQSYVHKILTGRLDQFAKLREMGGLSGFPKPQESPHDIFATGHSSTSISVGLGLAKARDLLGERYKVISVIGDGSLTGGLAFEALNNAEHLKTDLIVILNDNEMSIAPNVGALSTYLSRARINPTFYKIRADLEQFIQRIPKVGETTFRYLDKIKDSLKYLVIPGILFEELGFTYVGPVDGHNLRQLTQTLAEASGRRGPLLIHVLTKKGYGYQPAEENPSKYHGVPGFEVSTGQLLVASGQPTYTQIFGTTLTELAAEDERIVAITAAMTEGTGLKSFAQAYPERFFDVGIAEAHAVTMAGGLARAGLKPVVAIYSTFLQRAFDQIIHDVCLQELPVVFAIDRAGVVGEDGPTHHGVFDLAYLRMIPGLTIMAPKDENELRQMLLLALKMDKPVAIRYPRGQVTGGNLTTVKPIAPGEAEVVRTGEQAAILALGPLVDTALEAADLLSKMGINCAVLNARFVKPLDRKTILYWARRVPHLITVEDHILTGGFGSAVLELLADSGLRKVQVSRLGYPDHFLETGTIHQLHNLYGLTAEGIMRTVTRRPLTLAGGEKGK